jgi:hypothetical protein
MNNWNFPKTTNIRWKKKKLNESEMKDMENIIETRMGFMFT